MMLCRWPSNVIAHPTFSLHNQSVLFLLMPAPLDCLINISANFTCLATPIKHFISLWFFSEEWFMTVKDIVVCIQYITMWFILYLQRWFPLRPWPLPHPFHTSMCQSEACNQLMSTPISHQRLQQGCTWLCRIWTMITSPWRSGCTIPTEISGCHVTSLPGKWNIFTQIKMFWVYLVALMDKSLEESMAWCHQTGTPVALYIHSLRWSYCLNGLEYCRMCMLFTCLNGDASEMYLAMDCLIQQNIALQWASVWLGIWRMTNASVCTKASMAVGLRWQHFTGCLW